MIFASRLKELRTEKGFTQRELAKIIGLSPNSICEWEKGRCEPSIESLKALSLLFECSIDHLTGNTDDFGNITIKNPPTEKLSAEDKELLEYFHTLTKSEKIQVTEYTRYLSERGESQKKPVRKNKLA